MYTSFVGSLVYVYVCVLVVVVVLGNEQML
jgi:hypothetical protein